MEQSDANRAGGRNYTLTIPIGTPLREAERLVIEATLQDTGGNVAWAARVLEINRSTLHKKINEYERLRQPVRHPAP